MDRNNLRLKAVETALEWTKQIITLSTAVLVVSGTFIKDVLNKQLVSPCLIEWCWGLLCFCIIMGIMFLGSLCSMLTNEPPERISIYRWQPRILGILHFFSFVAAIILFAIFAYKNF